MLDTAKYGSLLWLLVALLACENFSQKNDERKGECSASKGMRVPNIGIVNGEATSDFPEVVLLAGYHAKGTDTKQLTTCTGTFVSHNTLITAAHCVDSSPDGGVVVISDDQISAENLRYSEQVVALLAKGIKPLKAFHNGITGESSESSGVQGKIARTKLDFAILIFPKDTWETQAKVLGRPLQKGELATMVGFGYSSPTSQQLEDLLKRRGETVISRWQPTSGLIHVLSADADESGHIVSASKYAFTASGDSGGPVFVGSVVAGVLSGGNALESGVDSALYVDLASPESKAVIEAAKAEGAEMFFDDPAPRNADSGTVNPESAAATGKDGC